LSVELFKNKVGTRVLVHRLVASAFIGNPAQDQQVNHKDECTTNNNVCNLEWVSRKNNMNYGTRLERQLKNTDFSTQSRKSIAICNGKKACKPVTQMDKQGQVLCFFESGKQASKITGVSASKISDALNGKRKTVGGFKWACQF
jgi:hypothetical protein